LTGPLSGLRVVNTRAVEQAPELDRLLLLRGAIPVAFPCIAIAPPLDCAGLDRELHKLAQGQFDWLLLTSANAVEAVVSRLSGPGALVPPATNIGVVGPVTAAAVQNRFGIEPTFEPSVATGAELARTIPIQAGERVLIPSSDLARTDGVEILRNRGAIVTVINAYRTVPGGGGADLPQLLSTGEIHALTFCSPSAVARFCERLQPHRDTLGTAQNLPAACIGTSTQAAAKSAGFVRSACPERHTIEDLVDLLEQMLSAQTIGGSRWL
jgi:uroporphyrinogen-III synthase